MFNNSHTDHLSREDMKVLADIRRKRDLSKVVSFHTGWLTHWPYSPLPAEGISCTQHTQPTPPVRS